MINLVFDLQNIFHRSLFIVGGFGKKQYTFDSEEELSQLMRKVAMDVSQIIRNINPSRTIFCLDSKSWRKGISIDENDGYKAQRIKNKSINWDNVYGIMNEFLDIVSHKGFIVSRVSGAEADDIMALWKDELQSLKQHVILVSADEDIRQLVGGTSESYTTVYNPFIYGKGTKRFFIPAGFLTWLGEEDPGDIFNRSIDMERESFKKILSDPKLEGEEVYGKEIAFRKIFCGDDGDNVPAIWTWINEKGKEVRITETKYRKIIESIGVKDPLELLERSSLVKEELERIVGSPIPIPIRPRIERQLKLVLLDPNIFPEAIVSDFKKGVKEALEKRSNTQTWNLSTLLEGTKYLDPTKSDATPASIFSEIDRIQKNLF